MAICESRNGIDPLFARKRGSKGRKDSNHTNWWKETAEQALGISSKKLDLSKLDWKTFDGSGDSKPTAKAEEKKSESFQVQVSVADLRIRKEPSTSAPSAGMIAKELTPLRKQ